MTETTRRRKPIRRRANGEGTIYLRSDGRWGGTLTLPDGRRRTVYARTNAEIQQRLREVTRRQEQGLLVASAQQKTGAYLLRWLEESARPSVRTSTFTSYQLHVRRLLPLLGHHRLSSLTPAHVQGAYAELHRRGLAPQTVQHVHTVLHQALKQAVVWGILPRNPCDGAARPRVERREMETLSEDQVKQLFASTRGDRDHALWVLLASTGLRLGEALGLKWEDFSPDFRRLQVRRALQRQAGKGLVFVEPKSARSRRVIELAPGTAHIIAEHRQEQVHHRLSLGAYWRDHDLVFCTDGGHPLDGGQVNWRFHRALARAGLPQLRVHDLRHTAASLLMAKGVHPKVVQEMLGHSTITLTLDTYSHVTPGLQADAAQRMQSLFS